MCDTCNYSTWENKISDMIDEPVYDCVIEVLKDIFVWVVMNRHITSKQKDAVINIIHAKE